MSAIEINIAELDAARLKDEDGFERVIVTHLPTGIFAISSIHGSYEMRKTEAFLSVLHRLDVRFGDTILKHNYPPHMPQMVKK